MAQKPRAARGATLKVTTTIEPDADGRLPSGEVAAYAFSAGGHFISSAPVAKSGAANLKVMLAEEPTGARIIVGPKLDEPDLTELLRRGAVEAHVRLDPWELQPVTILVEPVLWLCWFLSRCTARGTVLKRTVHNGEPLDLPVCGAEVEIYEVDPIWILIPRLPDDAIVRIRHELLRPLPIPLPDPPPDEVRAIVGPPGPGPDPAPFLRAASGEAPAHEMARSLAAPGAASLTLAAQTASVAQLRQQLVLNPEIARLLLCIVRPKWVTKTLIGTATTDECGHFRYKFFRGCHNPDQPDLYFRVLQPLFFGIPIPIYEPTPVSCYTHWDYNCDAEVTIYTSSPFAHTCSPCPPLDPGPHNNYVAVMNIGNLLTSNIYGVPQALAATTTTANRGQQTIAGKPFAGKPFGSTLNPHLEFDPQLRDSLGVRYYRVTVQLPGGGSPRELDTECYRHFRHAVPGGEVVEPYLLGPKTVPGPSGPVPHLFEIPPSVPPLGVWSTPNPYEDQANAKWDSTMEAPGVPDSDPDRSGKFELKIELFDAAGKAVDTGALGIGWLVPRETSVSGAIVLHLDPPATGVVQGDAFLLPLHVDNNHCTAHVDPPVLNGSTAADQCGVMRYHPTQSSAGTVELPYSATQRNGFANYSFRVQRGVELVTPPTTSGPVGAGSFTPSETVLNLLSRMPAPPPLSPPCTIGAFLEDLTVIPSATDGWGQAVPNARDTRAFTLAPQ